MGKKISTKISILDQNSFFFDHRQLKMQKILFLIFHLTIVEGSLKKAYFLKDFNQEIVLSQREIAVPGVEYGFNPSMIPYGDKILMVFRYQPNIKTPWISFVALILLDGDFSLCGDMQILDLRGDSPIPSRCEDARIFWLNDKIYIVYNDNLEPVDGAPSAKREMYLAEVIPFQDRFLAGKPLLLRRTVGLVAEQEKNWVPIVYKGELLLGYSILPHEILKVDLATGACPPFAKSSFMKVKEEKNFSWIKYRGGTPALSLGDHYLAFFHSYDAIYSEASRTQKMYHYFAGAYLFSAEPPFNITKISPFPIVGRDFYTASPLHKRVVYPSGFIIKGDKIHLCYGKDDSKMVVATLSVEKLLASLIDVKSDQIHYQLN
jgi:predicted GH43/DUF377 family glycosyl hydrolase